MKAAAGGESPHSATLPVTKRDWVWLLARPTVCSRKTPHLSSTQRYTTEPKMFEKIYSFFDVGKSVEEIWLH